MPKLRAALKSVLLAFLLSATPAAAGPGGIQIDNQLAETIQRVHLACEDDRSQACPTIPTDPGYCVLQEGIHLYHSICNGESMTCPPTPAPPALEPPVPCVPVVAGELPAALYLSATEVSRTGECDLADRPDDQAVCVNVELTARLDVQGPGTFFSREQRLFTHPRGFWSGNCTDDDSPGGVRVSDWLPFRNRHCPFAEGFSFTGMVSPGNLPLILPDGLPPDERDPQLIILEAALVGFGEDACGFQTGSVLPVAMLATGQIASVGSDDLKESANEGVSRSGWYPLTVRYAQAAAYQGQLVAEVCGEVILTACANGQDDDGDGLEDYPSDPGCADGTDLSERSLPCDDGLDNDGDGRLDFPADPGCKKATSATERTQCQDGVDNEGETGIDFDGGESLDLDHNGFVDVEFNPATPAVGEPDPECTAASRNVEDDVTCGVGPELSMLVPLLRGARRLRRRVLRGSA